MEQLVLEGGPELRDEFEKFAQEHPDNSSVEVARGFDGASIVSLIIENAPHLSASLALLIATIQKRKLHLRLTRDGIDLGLSDFAKNV